MTAVVISQHVILIYQKCGIGEEKGGTVASYSIPSKWKSTRIGLEVCWQAILMMMVMEGWMEREKVLK